ncbi:uncharacterized protein LOC116196599 [Punica granatum]|uniref:Uncharacterized protein LOC116196599 n=1 Tax=Punica granatum TaxID=22663 RepID=A0A6P8CQD8_PUNGR|nr:uncharacterized protein LOC116196599 [Punica granatum]
MYSISGREEMDPTGLRHYRSSSSGGDRFLSLFSFSPPPDGGSDELNEAEVCFSDNFLDPANVNHLSSTTAIASNRRHQLSRQLQSSGLLAALPAATASKQIPPSRPVHRERELAKTAPCRKFQQSAPVSVPILSSAAMAGLRKSRFLEEEDDEEDEEMLPPHEIVALRSHGSAKSTCSVLEGAGRTLKGRDLRQVRNAVWRRTGFLD